MISVLFRPELPDPMRISQKLASSNIERTLSSIAMRTSVRVKPNALVSFRESELLALRGYDRIIFGSACLS
jgi:hypothetical protein